MTAKKPNKLAVTGAKLRKNTPLPHKEGQAFRKETKPVTLLVGGGIKFQHSKHEFSNPKLVRAVGEGPAFKAERDKRRAAYLRRYHDDTQPNLDGDEVEALFVEEDERQELTDKIYEAKPGSKCRFIPSQETRRSAKMATGIVVQKFHCREGSDIIDWCVIAHVRSKADVGSWDILQVLPCFHVHNWCQQKCVNKPIASQNPGRHNLSQGHHASWSNRCF